MQRAIFRDYIPLRGIVVPRNTIYLDALEGGRIEEVLVEAGDLVSAGQPLIQLSNTELELDVLDREARLIESITQLQTYRTQLEQNRLNNEKALELINYDIVRLTRDVERNEKLAEEGLISKQALDAVKDELGYSRSLKPLQKMSNDEQDLLRRQQLPSINVQIGKMQRDIEITRGKLSNLTVRAPSQGRMTAIDLKIGQNVARGARLGEITVGTDYKLSAAVDEFYLRRVVENLEANALIGSVASSLRVMRVYPQVKGGTFTIDLEFLGQMPKGLLPGQAVQGSLDLGGDRLGLVAPSGPYLQTTGGNWMFVVSPDKESAQRRNVKTGRRNAEQVEILDGIREGERVLVSDYAALERAERVVLVH